MKINFKKYINLTYSFINKFKRKEILLELEKYRR
jgi:hypothetical protein